MPNTSIINQKPTQSFLKALQASIWSHPLDPTFFEELSPVQWQQLVKLSLTQTVEGLICQSIQNLPGELLPNKELLLKWIVRQQRVISYNERVSQTISFTNSLFRENGINAVLLKGMAVAQYYPVPLLRTGGDIDWYFPTISDFQMANKLMAIHGEDYRIQSRIDTDYRIGKVPVEHHSRLINMYNPFVQKFIRRFEMEEKSFARTILIAGQNVRTPSTIAEILLINTHILHHQIGYGIGLRHLCDAALIYKNSHGRYDKEQLKYAYKKLGLLRWAEAHHYMLTEILDLDKEFLPFAPRRHPKWNDQTLDLMLKGGNFSFYDPGNPDIETPFSRINRPQRLTNSFFRNYRIAPMEAICFPFTQFYRKHLTL